VEGLLATPNMFPKEHYLPSLATDVRSAGEDSDAALQFPIKRIVSCRSKEDGRAFILLYDKHPEADSASILAVNCSPTPGDKMLSKSHCRATIVQAQIIYLPFYGRGLLLFNGGKHAVRAWQLIRYEMVRDRSHGPYTVSLAELSAVLTIVNSELTPNDNPAIQECRCFVGAAMEMFDKRYSSLKLTHYEIGECSDEDVSFHCISTTFYSPSPFQRRARWRAEVRRKTIGPEAQTSTAQREGKGNVGQGAVGS
jgi:hypothetical protein